MNTYHRLASEFLVHSAVGLELALSVGLVLGIELNLESLGAVQTVVNLLADDLSRVEDIVEDGLVHLGEGTAARAELTLLAVEASLLGQDTALSNNDDVLAAELLLEVLHQQVLHLVVAVEQNVRHNDHDDLLGATGASHRHLSGVDQVQVLDLALELVLSDLQIVESLSHGLISAGRLLLQNLLSPGVHVVLSENRKSAVRRNETKTNKKEKKKKKKKKKEG